MVAIAAALLLAWTGARAEPGNWAGRYVYEALHGKTTGGSMASPSLTPTTAGSPDTPR